MSSVVDLRAYVNPSVIQTLVLVDLQQEYIASPRVLALEETKGALVNLTRAVAIDHARDNIRVNAVCPGYLENPTSISGPAPRASDQRNLVAKHPLGRLGRPEDVAHAIAFLASEDASFITGTTLVVDGGYSAQ